MPKFNELNARAYGRNGGLTTVARHGRAHMAKIGAQGFAATVAKHYGGDRQRYLQVLQRRGLLALCDKELDLIISQPPRPMLFGPYRQMRLDEAEPSPWHIPFPF
jgi:phage tail sheath gpL-like